MKRVARPACALLVTVSFVALAGVASAPGDTGGRRGPSEPIRIVLLAEDEGESAQAVPYYADGVQLAEQDLDGAVEVVRIPAPLDPAQAENALLEGVDENPAGIIGFPASSQVDPLGPTIGEEGLPFIALSTIESAVKGGPSGADNLFFIRPVSQLVAAAEARYVVNTLEAESVGLLCVNNPFGTTGCRSAKRVLERNDVDVSVERTNEITATDLTEQALAMEDVDVVMDFNFPNPLGVFANQLVDNGIEAMHVDGASAGIAVQSGSVQGPAAENLIGVDDCVPAESDQRNVRRWVNRFEEEFDYTPIYNAAEAYDAVMILNEAVQQAGSTDPAAVVEAMTAMNYEGICTQYQTDPTNVMNHASDFVGFNAEGDIRVLKHFTVGEFEPTEATTTTAAPTSGT